MKKEFKSGQTSLINWLKELESHQGTVEDILVFDNSKTKRLELLHSTIDLPINTTHLIDGAAFDIGSRSIQDIIKERGGEGSIHAFRISPKPEYLDELSVVKKYGITFAELDAYFTSEQLDRSKVLIRVTNYRGALAWAAVFVVSQSGIVGELTKGSLYALTYSDNPDDEEIVTFYRKPGGELTVSSSDAQYREKAKEIVSKVKVESAEKRKALEAEGFNFADEYLVGYYEYIEGTDGDSAFTDINNKEVAMNVASQNLPGPVAHASGLHGLVVSAGKGEQEVEGTICRITDDAIGSFKAGSILLCTVTTAAYLPAMKEAKAIITEIGGLMSHPSIIARELGIPCVVGVKDATTLIHDGEKVRIELIRGEITGLS